MVAVTLSNNQPDWFDEIWNYATSVTTGSRIAAQTEQQACQLFLNDYQQSLSDKNYPYQFNALKAWKVIRFIQLLPHVKGDWAARTGTDRLIKLQPWQKFIIANIFGWIKKSDGLRRFNTAYIEVPRKNGKSILAAGIGLYMLCADGEVGAEVYCGAGSLKQADEVFSPAMKMVERTPSLRKAYRIELLTKKIYLKDGSKFEPLIGKPGDGSSPSCAIVDEYHEHPTSDLYETMNTGMGARKQPLMLVITTAGANLFSPCYDMHKDAKLALQDPSTWPGLFTILYGLDDDDKTGDTWTQAHTLEKANPNYGISVYPSFVESQQKLAEGKPGKQNAFKTKHLNIWCNAKHAYFNALNWLACHDKTLILDDFHGQECWIGVDLAKKRDLSAVVLLFKRYQNSQWHYYLFTRFYLPEETITNQDNKTLETLYTKWVNEGYLITCPGNEMDFNVIRDDILDDSHRFDVVEVPHDPHGAIQISHELDAAGMLPVSMPQHGNTYTLPINELEAAIDSGRVHHDGNPVMAWCINNTIVHEYRGGNKMPDKEEQDAKIDGVSALLMALNRGMSLEEQQSPDVIFL